MPKEIECRHGVPHSQSCEACGTEYRHLEQFRAERQRTNDTAIVKARELGRNHTFIDTDGCEVTVTTDGHIFYNAADWY